MTRNLVLSKNRSAWFFTDFSSHMKHKISELTQSKEIDVLK